MRHPQPPSGPKDQQCRHLGRATFFEPIPCLQKEKVNIGQRANERDIDIRLQLTGQICLNDFPGGQPLQRLANF